MNANKYLPIFEENEVTLQELPLFSYEMLKDLGIPAGPAAKIAAASAKYRKSQVRSDFTVSDLLGEF